MLIELIFEFKWKGPGLPGRTCIPTTGYFHGKIDICKKNHRLSYYSLLKYCNSQCTLLPPTRAKSLTKFGTKMQNFKRVLDLKAT